VIPPTPSRWEPQQTTAFQVARLLGVLLILQTVLAVWISYGAYFPPDFSSDFLLGRRSYFFGPYGVAFYAHIVSGPFALVAGLLLLSERFRRRSPAWHRRLGRVQVAGVLLLLAPSGFWMAWYAVGGTPAATGFAALALATVGATLLGWKAAVRRRFDEHRRWMQRCSVLLCSAVVLRAIGGASELLGTDWTYPYAAWLSWLLPLSLLELIRINRPALPFGRSPACRGEPGGRYDGR
jgi:hypothetical protein